MAELFPALFNYFIYYGTLVQNKFITLCDQLFCVLVFYSTSVHELECNILLDVFVRFF